MHRVPVSLVPVVALLVLAGCGPTAPPAPQARPVAPAATVAQGHADHDHDHDHDEPASLADGVAKLESLAEDLADKLAENAGEAADDAVHDIGHLLEEVREQANKVTEPAADVAALQKGLDELEECFGKVDEAFHSGDAKVDPKEVLASVKDRIQAAIKSIKEVLR